MNAKLLMLLVKRGTAQAYYPDLEKLILYVTCRQKQ